MKPRSLENENEDLRQRLAEADQANRALVAGQVDAVLLETSGDAMLLGHAQAALRSSEQLFRALFNEALDAILIADDSGRYVDVNPAACRLFGVAREQLLGRSIADFSERAGDVPAAWTAFRTAGQGAGEFRVVRPNGEIRETEFAARADFLPGFHLSIMRDVTERKREAHARRSYEERFRRIGETTSEGVWLLDADGRTAYVNDRMALMAGCSAQELLGRRMNELLDRPRAEAAEPQARYRDGQGDQFECPLRRKGGGDLTVRVTTNPLFDADGQYDGVLVMVTDMTERRQLEHQLRHAQKMDGIGRFAGGIAHDFNNVLGVIMGYGDAALRCIGDPQAVRSKIEAIQKAADRAAALTRQILAFSRKQVLVPRVLDLRVVIEDLGGMLRRLIGEDIELFTVIPATLGRVRADPSQIEQVIVNLAANARDAMPEGGRLTITLRNDDVDEKRAAEHLGLAPGPYVALEVRDTGAGIPPALMEKIFEPFFTTKDPGKGTGLGLSMVYGIVKQSDGYVAVESRVGGGTAFTVYLPRLLASETAGREKEPAVEASPRGAETVLLVEDDDVLRGAVEETLAALGYRVIAAPGAAQAIERHEQLEPRPHVLVTDVVMPGMNGRELADRLVAEQPDLRVLFISGYSDDFIFRQQVADARRGFLQKPFLPVALARKIRELLDSTPKPQA